MWIPFRGSNMTNGFKPSEFLDFFLVFKMLYIGNTKIWETWHDTNSPSCFWNWIWQEAKLTLNSVCRQSTQPISHLSMGRSSWCKHLTTWFVFLPPRLMTLQYCWFLELMPGTHRILERTQLLYTYIHPCFHFFQYYWICIEPFAIVE